MSLLEVKDLQIAFKNKKNKNKPIEVIDNVSFSLEDDEILGIVGESGCGKTTLSRGILKVINHRSGNIIIDGKPIEEISRGEMSEKIQMIFQNPLASFNPRYTIKHSLYETARVHKIKQADFKKELQQLYEYTGLTEEMASKYPGQLSGGQLQRFAIVRALIVKPKIIIADEAVAALDVSIQTDILNLLLYLRKKLHIAILFISHDLRVVKNICDRVLVMYLGTVFEFGNTTVISRLIEGEYFKIEQMLSSDYETKVKINKKRLNECLDRSTIYVKEGDKKPIVLDIKDDSISIKINSATGNMNENVPASKSGKDMVIGFNPRFVIDALNVIDDEEIELDFVNSKAPCFIKKDDMSYVYVVLPVTISAV